MPRVSGYRSWIILAAAALIGLTACDADNKKHETIKAEMRRKWEGARIAVMYQLAKQQYEAGEFDKCRETLGKASAINQPFAPMNILAGRLELEKGDLERASTQFQVAQQLDPASAEASYYLGVVHQRWQNAEQAYKHYRNAWEKKPSEVGYLLAAIEMQLTMGQIDDAQQLLLDKLTYFEQTAAIRVALARTYALKGDMVAAAKAYRDAVVLSPDDLGLRQTYAETLYFAGKYAEALPVLEDLRKNSNVVDRTNLRMILGQTYLALRRTREARLCFQEITQESPNNTEAWLSLGKVYLQDNEAGQTVVVARRVLKNEPQNLRALILKALAEQKQRRWDEAQKTLVTAQQVAPKDSTILCLMGVNSQGQGRAEAAARYFEQALKINPQDAWAQELLATVKPRESNPVDEIQE